MSFVNKGWWWLRKLLDQQIIAAIISLTTKYFYSTSSTRETAVLFGNAGVVKIVAVALNFPFSLSYIVTGMRLGQESCRALSQDIIETVKCFQNKSQIQFPFLLFISTFFSNISRSLQLRIKKSILLKSAWTGQVKKVHIIYSRWSWSCYVAPHKSIFCKMGLLLNICLNLLAFLHQS